MQTHAWASAYRETLAEGPLLVWICGEPNKPEGLAAFARSRSGPRQYSLLGSEDLWESIEVAARSPEAARAIAACLARQDAPLSFGHYPDDTPFLDDLAAACRGRALLVRRAFDGGAMPRIALDESWRTPEAKLNSRRRSDLRRMGRIAAELGNVSFEIDCPSSDIIERRLDEAFEVEAAGWKGRSGTAILKDGAKQAFYRSYARKMAGSGQLRLCFMRIDGRPVAMQIAVVLNNAFWLLKIGYDENARRCSPGNLLMRETIAYAAGAGLTGYEFLGKEAEWTRLWASDARPIARARLYPFTLYGGLGLAGDAAAIAGRRLSARLQRSPRRSSEGTPRAEPADQDAGS